MFARAFLSFHPAGSLPTPKSSQIQLFRHSCPERHSRGMRGLPVNSNYSRTSAMPGGGGYTGFLVRPIHFVSKAFISPTYEISVRNSLVSPTYAKTGGVHPSKNVGAPTFSLSFLPIPNLDTLSFLSFAHSFIFRSTTIPCLPSALRTLSQETGGVSPVWSYQLLPSGSRMQNPPASEGGRYRELPRESPITSHFLYLIYFLYLLYLPYQLLEFAHQLLPAPSPTLPTEVTPK
jgi:hypothetical protein